MRDRWAVILAGGDGTRLQSMTRAITGDNRPKQFVPVIGGATLLDQTRRRVALSVIPGRTLIVVTQKHRQFYDSLAQQISPGLLLQQPGNKGTAPAILYALLRVATRSPKAIVALFPSDHYFNDDEEFMSHIDAAFDAVQTQPEQSHCLGLPDERRKRVRLDRTTAIGARKCSAFNHTCQKVLGKTECNTGRFPDGAWLPVE